MTIFHTLAARLIKHLLCTHAYRLSNIEWDGTSEFTCQHCGKTKRVPL